MILEMDLFKQNISSLISVTDTEMDQILHAFNIREIRKGGTLIKENTFCNHYYFLEKGLLRMVYHFKDISVTPWVIFEGLFFTEIVSMKSKKRTNVSVEAMEPSTVYAIDENSLNALCDKVKSFERYLRLTWEETLYRFVEIKVLGPYRSAKERYEMLINDKALLQRVPQKYLASILGITPYSLSRLRRPKKI
jgi:signal-transduction protein with cAMP-binding, CBS, and nucleotidyltransferase domain